MSRIWKVQASRYLAKYRIFDLREDICVSPRTGSELPFYVLETRDWINVIPMTQDGDIVLVRQYRFGTGEVTLEIPGGLVDLEDESPAIAAKRELCEETGYVSDDMVSLGSVRPNPAIQNNTCHIFLARNVVQKYDQSLDAGEDIAVELYSREEVNRMIRHNEIDHGIVLNAFYFLDLYEKGEL